MKGQASGVRGDTTMAIFPAHWKGSTIALSRGGRQLNSSQLSKGHTDSISIRNMRVTKSPTIFTLRYGHDNWKYWSHLALTPMGKKHFLSPSPPPPPPSLSPQTPMLLKRDHHCRLLFAVKKATRYTNLWEFRDLHTLYMKSLGTLMM